MLSALEIFLGYALYKFTYLLTYFLIVRTLWNSWPDIVVKAEAVISLREDWTDSGIIRKLWP